jgi:RNA polymerase sigma-70 factor (ECF subfamily)
LSFSFPASTYVYSGQGYAVAFFLRIALIFTAMPEQHDTEQAAIRLVLSGDKEAYRSLVLRYGPRLAAFCRSRLEAAGVGGAAEEAEDMAQEVLVRAYISLHRFRLGESFAAWLFAIAANRVKTRFRFFARQQKLAQSAANSALVALQDNPEDKNLMKIQGEALIKAIASLPKDLRLPMELYYIGELSVAETAKLLKLGQEAVKTRLFRGRKALKEMLESRKPPRVSGGIQ